MMLGLGATTPTIAAPAPAGNQCSMGTPYSSTSWQAKLVGNSGASYPLYDATGAQNGLFCVDPTDLSKAERDIAMIGAGAVLLFVLPGWQKLLGAGLVGTGYLAYMLKGGF